MPTPGYIRAELHKNEILLPNRFIVLGGELDDAPTLHEILHGTVIEKTVGLLATSFRGEYSDVISGDVGKRICIGYSSIGVNNYPNKYISIAAGMTRRELTAKVALALRDWWNDVKKWNDQYIKKHSGKVSIVGLQAVRNEDKRWPEKWLVCIAIWR